MIALARPSASSPDDRTRRTQRTIIFSALGFVVLIGAVVGYWLWQSRSLTLERAREVMQGFALTHRTFTEQALDNAAGVLEEIGGFYVGRTPVAAPPDLVAFARLRRTEAPLIHEILLLDRLGHPVLWTGVDTPPPPADLMPAPMAERLARTVAADRRWLSPVFADPTNDGRFSFALGIGLKDTVGNAVGTAIALIDQATFAASFSTILDSAQSSVAMVHVDGTIMARLPDPGGVVGAVIPLVANRPEPGPARRILVQASPVDGVVRIVAEWRLTKYPLIAAVTLARSAALVGWRQDLAWGLGIVLLAGVAVTALSAGLLRQVRLQAEARAALQRQNTVLAAQLETSADGVLLVDTERTVLSWNLRFASMWGLDGQDLDSLSSDMLLTRAAPLVADPEAFVARISELYANPDMEEREGTEIRLVDGRIFERYARVLRDDDGSPWGRSWFYRDVTQRRRSEWALRESEQRFRDVANAADEFIWEVDADGRLTFVTERAQDILGYPVAAVLGRSPVDFIAAEDIPAVQAAVDVAMRTGSRLDLSEYRARRSDGLLIWMRTSAVPILDDSGAVRGLRGASMSIDDLKAREIDMQEANERLEDQAAALVELAEQLDSSNREIRSVQERFDLAMRGTTDGIYDWDLRTNRIYLSPRWREMLGLGGTEAEVPPAYCTARIHPEDYLNSVRALSQHLGAETQQYRHVHRVRHQNGSYLWVLDRAQVVRDLDGIAVRLVGTHADITEMRRYEDALRQAKTEAEAANAAKSRFLAVMSHEIRTPMTGVLGMTDLLTESGLTPRQQTYAATLRRSADTLLGLLDDILDFSKIEANQITLEKVDFRPAEVIEDVVQLFSFNASEKGLTLETQSMGRLPAVLRGDPHRLRQVLFNLVGNAIKFTDRGHVSVGIDAVQPLPQDRVRLTIRVRDTGIGLSLEARDRLFQPFIQADDSTTRRFGGTGLGLAICKRLVTLMGGDIEVDAAGQGQGSVFRFSVVAERGDPARLRAADRTRAASSARAAAADLPPAPPPGCRILLAEDTAANRLLLGTMLERLGYTVVEVADGAAALEAVQAGTEQFDLVLMDMQMPVMDGTAATRAIRALPGNPPPVVGLTADALLENRATYLASGLEDILTKPVEWDELAAVVARSRRQRPVPSEVVLPDLPEAPPPDVIAEQVADHEGADAVDPDPAQASVGVVPGPIDPIVVAPDEKARAEPVEPVEPVEPIEPAPAADPDSDPQSIAAGPVPAESLPLFDPTMLETLRRRVGSHRVAMLVESMLTSLDDQLAALTEAAHESVPAERVATTGHALKGLASQFGALRLAALSLRLQHGDVDGAALTDHLPDLREVVRATRASVVAWLETEGAPTDAD